MNLKKCPFCGGEADIVDQYGAGKTWCVRCEKCWGKSIFTEDKDEAIKAWNTRPDNLEADKCVDNRCGLVDDERCVSDEMATLQDCPNYDPATLISKSKLSAVTKERDEAVELLRKCRYMVGMPDSIQAAVVKEIEAHLSSLDQRGKE